MNRALTRRNFLLTTIMILLLLGGMSAYVLTRHQPERLPGSVRRPSFSYLLVGGQNGTWFRDGQAPRLYYVTLPNYSVASIVPVPSQGTVWTGAWNGSQWLISGWGTDPGPVGSNPYIYLDNGQGPVLGEQVNQYQQEASWHGGDIFAASYNGSDWLLSGLGSGVLGNYSEPTNHMAAALFDGTNFTDLSTGIPDQWDAILYTSAWNGHYWLVGGGYEGDSGVLFRYDGVNFTDIGSEQWKIQFHSVQAIHWNGNYWLIGGVGFLMKYDGENFTDLTPELDQVLDSSHEVNYKSCCNAVNALSWNGSSWMIGGGAPISVTQPLTAWAVSFDGEKFINLTPLISNLTNAAHPSSILSITSVLSSWYFGGFSNGKAMLFSYANSTITDLSNLINPDMTVVNWVGGLFGVPKISQTHTPQTGTADADFGTSISSAYLYSFLAFSVELADKIKMKP